MISDSSFPFDAVSFYEEHKETVWKYIRANTENLEIEDWIGIPDSWTYMSNSNILAGNLKDRKYSAHQKLEWIKCCIDVVYFTQKYVKIINVDEGVIPFNLYDYQRDLLDLYHNNRFVVSMQARQMGKTQTTAAFLLHFALFNKAKTVAILANKAIQAQEILERIQQSFEEMPYFLQRGVVVYNKTNMTFENKSKIFSAASGSSSIRGKSVSLLYIDEAAFIPNDMQFYESTYPVITSGKKSRVIITSTPQGSRGLFYKLWTESDPARVENRNSYARLLVTWDMHPDRDEKWKEETIKNTSAEQFRQEFECCFRGSQNSILSTEIMDKLISVDPIAEGIDFRMYEEPIKGHVYVMTVDTSRGLGQDYSVATVFDVTTVPYKITYIYASNTVGPMILSSIIMPIGVKYNNAWTLVEINDVGEAVASNLYYDLEYENVLFVYRDKNKQVVGAGKASSTVGVRTTISVKSIGCSNVKSLLEKDKLILNDYETINQFGNFVEKGNSYAADKGTHDDIVMTCVLFAWLTTQDYFMDLCNTDVRTLMQKEYNSLHSEEDLPVGFYDNGIDDNKAMFDDIPDFFSSF